MAPTRKYQGSRSLGFAATSPSEPERDGTRMWGRRTRARTGPSGRDRRMAIQVYRDWAEHEPKA